MTKRLYIFLGSITAFRLLYAIFLPLAPQEAYYWNYSRHPALSYFDHPPMAAYFIKLSTILGTSAFSIHLAAILISVPLTISIYRLGAMLFDEWVGFWGAVVINITFIYALGAVIITPDCPLLLFWVLSMLACYKIEKGEGNTWWILLGIFIGAGFASKYTIAFAGLGALLFFLTNSRLRRCFLTPWPYISLMAALVVALPVIYWNYTHDWASFAFQSSRRAGEMARFRADYFFGFIGTLIGIYGVVPAPLLGAGIYNSLRRAWWSRASNHILIICFSVPLVLFLIPIATRSWVKMNWTAPAFIGWFMAAVALFRARASQRKLLRIWGVVSFVFLCVAFVAAHILALTQVYIGGGDLTTGWESLAAKVQEVRQTMPSPYFIAGSEYKIQSELAFHLKDRPETVGANVLGLNALQYDYWSDPDTLSGYNAIYIYDRCRKCPEYKNELEKYFQTVDEPLILPIEKGGETLRNYYIYRCYNYRGLDVGK